MSKSYLTMFIMLLLVAGGCKNSDNSEQPQPIPPPPEVTNNKDEQQKFEEPIIQGQQPVSTVLTPPTNPEQRVKEITKGSSIPNRNPFDAIVPSVTPSTDTNLVDTIVISPMPQPNGTNNNNNTTTIISTTTTSKGASTTPSFNNNNSVAKKPVVIVSTVNKTSNVKPITPTSIPIPPPPVAIQKKIPSDIPTVTSDTLHASRGIPTIKPDLNPVFPPLPQPDQANGVSVTGIIDIDGNKHAIVKAPGEVHSRYVKTGDYLANGQVLVKDIDTNNPTIVLEEIGLDVAKGITTQSDN